MVTHPDIKPVPQGLTSVNKREPVFPCGDSRTHDDPGKSLARLRKLIIMMIMMMTIHDVDKWISCIRTAGWNECERSSQLMMITRTMTTAVWWEFVGRIVFNGLTKLQVVVSNNLCDKQRSKQNKCAYARHRRHVKLGECQKRHLGVHILTWHYVCVCPATCIPCSFVFH